MTKTAAEPLHYEEDDDSVVDTLIRWAGNERDAIRELLTELADACAENVALKAVRG